MGTVLLIATMDTKSEEAYYVRDEIIAGGHEVIIMNAGMFLPFNGEVDIKASEVVQAGSGMTIDEMLALKNKGRCIDAVIAGVEVITRRLFSEGKVDGIISIGGAQGTNIGTAAMRTLPFGIPKFMVATVASGTATFGPFVGTKDVIMMHSVCDIQGLNIVTRKVFENAAASICGMIDRGARKKDSAAKGRKGSIAVSMLGTTTPGALRAKELIEAEGYDFVAFHQNGTGGIAMEEMILEGLFEGVLDINLHEIGDRFVGGLHGSIREGRLESAAKCGLPQVIAPGSANYSVQGPVPELSDELKARKYIVHNPTLTLVRLTPEELKEVGRITAEKINAASEYTSVFIPLKGFSFPDAEGREHWEPEGNDAYISALKANLNDDVEYKELDLHINDHEFIDIAVARLFEMIEARTADN
ncbi:MAG: Tm-1-like ATP-binding domain-containing protein [Spirochaetales bacterium]|uniref:Tm-1-like ATP-binding domain-containing protein n=1 Tax=Candidatus Thalassospirochaeta sargassi TaxID=3119039 RepID=A0AAJ1MPE3_9SPIO|nr:Tm-1-like ATP-binding domain-containing protein [Spirochaetales bacterium]